jgi:tight adherence protein B
MTPAMIRLLILVLVFGAVILAVEGGLSWLRTSRGTVRTINKRLKLIATGQDRAEVLSRLRRNQNENSILPEALQGMRRALDRTLHGAGLALSPGKMMLIMAGAVMLLLIGIIVLASFSGYAMTIGSFTMILTFAFAAGFGIPLMVLSRMSDRRRKKVQEQFPVALDIFVRGLRAGHPIASALDLLTREMSDPIGSEFGIVVDEVTYGAELRDALQAMADRWDLTDMHMFVVCLAVQNETGGNLAEILENLSIVIRERASMLLKVRALSSEGRMTAVMLTALPVLAFVSLFLLNPAFYLDIADDKAFVPGFVSLIVLYFIGFFTIRRMVDLQV